MTSLGCNALLDLVLAFNLLKILIVSPTQSGIGGISQHVQGLRNYLTKHDCIVEIISSENTLTIPIKGLKNPSFAISSFLKIKSKKKFDIIHAFNLPSAISLKNATGKKILTIHGMYTEQIDLIHGKTIAKLSNFYEKIALRWADVVTVGSKQGYEYYSKLTKNIIYIPNAIDISSLPATTDRRFDNQLVFVGRLSKEKGISPLLEFAKILPSDIHLIIAGNGPEREYVEKVSKSLPNVHFVGFQEKNKAISLIRGSDILIQPSLSEGISSTILEAMACKIPIIATNVGGNKELLVHNHSGILIDDPSSDILLKEVLDILSNKQRAKSLVEAAYHDVQTYDWSNVGRLYLDLYRSLLV